MLLAGCASSPSPAPQNGQHQSPAGPGSRPVRQAIRQRLHAAPSRKAVTAGTALRGFYDRRDDQPAWFDAKTGKPNPGGMRFVHYLKDMIARQGLSRRAYVGSTVWASLQRPGARRAAALANEDIVLSRAFLQLARDIDRGRVNDPSIRSDWEHESSHPDYGKRLTAAVKNGDPGQVLDALQPKHDGYRRLVDALAHYRAIQAAGGWPRIPDGPTLHTGMHDPRVAALRKRLRIGGDLGAPVASGETTNRYTSRLSDAVRHFQRRHGLSTDGRVGPNTLTALNAPIAARISTLKLNLERWRWMPDNFGTRYIAVNIPAFSLAAVAHGKTVLTSKVIVGANHDNRATPVFAGRMRYLIFQPFWNVPHDIAVHEIIPHARRDPKYMAHHHFQIVRAFNPQAKPLAITPKHLKAVVAGRLQVRQAGGKDNALGRVKFMFPNHYAVYLHDTPARQLFQHSQRDFSHGCVRVAKPQALARFALAGRDGWDAARIDQAMHQSKRQRVKLAAPVPVYMMYWTAFVNAHGVNFRRDLYGRDAKLEQALSASSGHKT